MPSPVETTKAPKKPESPNSAKVIEAPDAVEVSKIVKRETELSHAVNNIVVSDAPSYERASEIVKAIKEVRTRISETFDPVVRSAHEAHKSAVAAKKKHDEPLADLERDIKGKMSEYVRAEREKEDRERRAREQEERDAAEAARREEVKALKNSGDEESAAIVQDAPLEIAPAAPVRPEVPRVAGVSSRTVWKFEVLDATKIPRDFMQPDLVKIGQYVRAMKGDGRIAGVRIYSDEQIAARG